MTLQDYNFKPSMIVTKAEFKQCICDLIARLRSQGPTYLVFHDHTQDIKWAKFLPQNQSFDEGINTGIFVLTRSMPLWMTCLTSFLILLQTPAYLSLIRLISLPHWRANQGTSEVFLRFASISIFLRRIYTMLATMLTWEYLVLFAPHETDLKQ